MNLEKEFVKKKVDKILIYSTTPIKKVVGEAEIEEVLIDEPEIIWKKTKEESGIDKNFFDKYYENKNEAVAYKLKNVMKYRRPRELKDYGVSTAPQSFQYIQTN